MNDIWGNELFDVNYLISIPYWDDTKSTDQPNKYTRSIDFDRIFTVDSTLNGKYTFLNTNVFFWLLENVEPVYEQLRWFSDKKTYNPGWSTDNPLNINSSIDHSIGFHRRKDAYAFMREFSQLQKFNLKFSQHTGNKFTLNLKTMTYTSNNR